MKLIDEATIDAFAGIGIGTVPYRAILKKRRGLGVELSAKYFADACGYCEAASRQIAMPDLFATLDHAAQAA